MVSNPKESYMEHIGIETSAMLVELNISTWSARKLDHKVSQQIDADHGARCAAGNYHKKLLAGNDALEAVHRYSARVRLWHAMQTLPWSDKGPRLITAAVFAGGYKSKLDEHQRNWESLLKNFLSTYDPQAAAFALGSLFNREDYPEPEDLASKFAFRYHFSPVPTSGDFRIDINRTMREELERSYQDACSKRVQEVMRDVWDRLYKQLQHMSERLSDDADGNRKIFHSTLITNAAELCDLLKNLNVTNDEKLEYARQDLYRAIVGVDASSLKESDELRSGLKRKVDDILSKFDF